MRKLLVSLALFQVPNLLLPMNEASGTPDDETNLSDDMKAFASSHTNGVQNSLNILMEQMRAMREENSKFKEHIGGAMLQLTATKLDVRNKDLNTTPARSPSTDDALPAVAFCHPNASSQTEAADSEESSPLSTFRKAPESKIALLMYEDRRDRFGTPLSNLTGPVNKMYCEKRGYDCVYVSDNMIGDLPLAWNKIAYTKKLVDEGEYEIIMVIDIDAMVIDQDRRLEQMIDPDKDLLLATDVGYAFGKRPDEPIKALEDGTYANSGVMIWRKSAWTKHALHRLLSDPIYESSRRTGAAEQGPLNDLIDEESSKPHVQLTDDTTFNTNVKPEDMHSAIHEKKLFVLHATDFNHRFSQQKLPPLTQAADYMCPGLRARGLLPSTTTTQRRRAAAKLLQMELEDDGEGVAWRRAIQAVGREDPPTNSEPFGPGAKADPVKVLGRSIVVLGMVKSFNMARIQGIQKLMGLCEWFDEGKCHVRVLHAPQKVDEAGDTENKGKENKKQKQKKKVDEAGLRAAVGLLSVYPNLVVQEDPQGGPETRTHFYAFLRNALLNDALPMDTDFLMAADLDDVVQWDNQTIGAITNALQPQNEGKWDALSFAATSYYDYWAVRCDFKSPNCFAHMPFDCSAPSFPCAEKAMRATDKDVFVPAISGFNGLAIYKHDAIGECRWDGRQTTWRENERPGFEQDCEHVGLNYCLARAGKRFMINAARIVVTWDGR